MLERYNIVSLKNVQDAGSKLDAWSKGQTGSKAPATAWPIRYQAGRYATKYQSSEVPRPKRLPTIPNSGKNREPGMRPKKGGLRVFNPHQFNSDCQRLTTSFSVMVLADVLSQLFVDADERTAASQNDQSPNRGKQCA
jgi:hypothetical protein